LNKKRKKTFFFTSVQLTGSLHSLLTCRQSCERPSLSYGGFTSIKSFYITLRCSTGDVGRTCEQSMMDTATNSLPAMHAYLKTLYSDCWCSDHTFV